MKLNVGCGYSFSYPGWIGIDYDATSSFWKNADSAQPQYMNVNVLNGIPMADVSVDVLYCSHMLEHFTYAEGIYVLGEFFRILKLGAPLCLVVPDLDIYIKKYVEHDVGFMTTRDIIGGTPLESFTDNFLMNFYSDPSFINTCHKYAFSFENLSAHLRLFGFEDIARVPFQQFTLDGDVNEDKFRCLAPNADKFSLSIECRKPVSGGGGYTEKFYKDALQYMSSCKFSPANLLRQHERDKAEIQSLTDEIAGLKAKLSNDIVN